MTGILELCKMSGLSSNGMALSWSEELLATAGNGGCSTYWATFDGTQASDADADEFGSSDSALVDPTSAAGDATAPLSLADNTTTLISYINSPA